MPGRTSDAVAQPALLIRNLSKTFRERPALRAAELEVRPGEVHGLVGQNGCGKSTLIKILAGYHAPDPGGEAFVHGRPVALGVAGAAHRAGVHFIHQDLGLVGDLSAVDNLALGESYAGRWWLSDRRERKAARELLLQYGLDIDVEAPVRTLSPARQTFVAIARALRGGVGSEDVLILDEPTAALPESEVAHLITLLRRLRDRGVAIVLVTHRLTEILQLADRVTVLRDGRTVTTTDVAGLDHDKLAELIIGRPIGAFYPSLSAERGAPLLEIEHLGGGHVEDVSLTVYAGEIVGIAGVMGSGYEELLGLVFGAVRRQRGRVSLAGRELRGNPCDSVRAGLAFAPADRKRLGALLTWTLRENLTLPSLRPQFGRRLSERRERADAAHWLDRLSVAADPEQGFWTLSGGNQQRVVLGRWLRHGAALMMLDEPTNGVDVGARHFIYEAIGEAAAGGTAVLVASADAEELAAICDRVLVVRGGVLVAELEGDQLTVDNVIVESLKAAPVTSPVDGPIEERSA